MKPLLKTALLPSLLAAVFATASVAQTPLDVTFNLKK